MNTIKKVPVSRLSLLKGKILVRRLTVDTDIFIPTNMSVASKFLVEVVALPKMIDPDYQELKVGDSIIVSENALNSISSKLVEHSIHEEYFTTTFESICCFVSNK